MDGAEREWRAFHSPDAAAAAAVASVCSSALLQKLTVLCGLHEEAQVPEEGPQRCVCVCVHTII